MAATVQALVDVGFGLSRFSRPELIPSQAAALVQVCQRTQATLFQFAARVNPLFFSDQVDVALTSGAWSRPTNAEAVFRIEGRGASTTPSITGEVLLVPYDDRAAFVGQPSVYRMGTRYFSAGNTGDPTAGELRFFYARRPAPLNTFASLTDSAFPDEFLPIFHYEIAAFNARADGGRDGELQEMVAERNRHIALFEAFLEHESLNESRRFGELRRFPVEQREPLKALVQAGGG